MSLNNLLVSNVKRKLHRRDSSESTSSSQVEKTLKKLSNDAPSDAIDDAFEGDEVFQMLNMSETLAKKIKEISRKLNKLEAIEETTLLNFFIRLRNSLNSWRSEFKLDGIVLRRSANIKDGRSLQVFI